MGWRKPRETTLPFRWLVEIRRELDNCQERLRKKDHYWYSQQSSLPFLRQRDNIDKLIIWSSTHPAGNVILFRISADAKRIPDRINMSNMFAYGLKYQQDQINIRGSRAKGRTNNIYAINRQERSVLLNLFTQNNPLIRDHILHSKVHDLH